MLDSPLLPSTPPLRLPLLLILHLLVVVVNIVGSTTKSERLLPFKRYLEDIGKEPNG